MFNKNEGTRLLRMETLIGKFVTMTTGLFMQGMTLILLVVLVPPLAALLLLWALISALWTWATTESINNVPYTRSILRQVWKELLWTPTIERSYERSHKSKPVYIEDAEAVFSEEEVDETIHSDRDLQPTVLESLEGGEGLDRFNKGDGS